MLNESEIGSVGRGINILVINESDYTVSNSLRYDTITNGLGGSIGTDIDALPNG